MKNISGCAYRAPLNAQGSSDIGVLGNTLHYELIWDAREMAYLPSTGQTPIIMKWLHGMVQKRCKHQTTHFASVSIILTRS